MSRYNNPNGNSNGDYENDITLKLQKYAAIRIAPSGLTASSHQQFGSSFISNFSEAEVIDGIVFQREDKPKTWKVFSAGKFFHLNPEDGLVYENFDDEDGYGGQMSAQDIFDHPRVAGFSESFGGDDYFYKPVGVVVEEAGEIAINDDLEVETTDRPSIAVGESSMLLSNKSWTRTFAKKMTTEGADVINDNGLDGDQRDENPKYDSHEWLATEDTTLRKELEGRTLELWITEDTYNPDDGDETTYSTPNLLDVKTGNFVTIDNGISSSDDDDDSQSQEAAADGGTTTSDSTSQDENTSEESSGSTDSSDDSNDSSNDDGGSSSGLPDDVPDVLEDLIEYKARNGDGNATADEIRKFAEDEVENPDDIDWEAAANEANQRAE